MNAIGYLKASGVANVKELLDYSKNDKAGFDRLKEMALEEMANKGIEISEPQKTNAA